VVNHGKQGFIHLKEKQKERREKKKTRTHKPESRQRDCGRGGAPPTARGMPSHAALGVEEVRKRTVLVITKRRVVGLRQPRMARSKTAEPFPAGAENTPKPARPLVASDGAAAPERARPREAALNRA
jgi:hypothetical protein